MRRTLDAEVPLASTWWVCIGITRFLPLAPAFHAGNECFYTGISRMSMELLAGEQSLEMLLFEPEVLVPHGPPEEHQYLRIEPAALVG